jgi:hypothetical protein
VRPLLVRPHEARVTRYIEVAPRPERIDGRPLGSPVHYVAGRAQHIESVFNAELVRKLWQEAEALLPSVH